MDEDSKYHMVYYARRVSDQVLGPELGTPDEVAQWIDDHPDIPRRDSLFGSHLEAMR